VLWSLRPACIKMVREGQLGGEEIVVSRIVN
jgi:hypothetical protein